MSNESGTGFFPGLILGAIDTVFCPAATYRTYSFFPRPNSQDSVYLVTNACRCEPASGHCDNPVQPSIFPRCGLEDGGHPKIVLRRVNVFTHDRPESDFGSHIIYALEGAIDQLAIIGAKGGPHVQLNHSIRSADEPVASSWNHKTFDLRTAKGATGDVDNLSVAAWRTTNVYDPSPIDLSDYIAQELSC